MNINHTFTVSAVVFIKFLHRSFHFFKYNTTSRNAYFQSINIASTKQRSKYLWNTLSSFKNIYTKFTLTLFILMLLDK